MKQSLQLNLHQQLTLTPQQQQSLFLLQLSSLELEHEITRILQDNPLLERLDTDDGVDSELWTESQSGVRGALDGEEIYTEMAWGDRSYGSTPAADDEERQFQQTDLASMSLRQHLLNQLSLTPMPERDRRLVTLLIEALDEDGYLTMSLEELAEMLPAQFELDLQELAAALKLLQSFDPVGVGARDLRECLLLQLDALPTDTPFREAAKRVVRDHLDLLAEREYGKLKRLLDIREDKDFIAVRQLITSLNPRPGASYARGETVYIVPDVIVKKVEGEWVVRINPAVMPRLRINEMYAGILRQHREGSASLTSQLQEARWLIQNVQKRFETILRVARAIVDHQRHFLEYGEVAMRPLTLREIGEALGLHESTISRVTTQKYMMTPRGIYEFKYFFGSALATDAGGAASSTAIKALIRRIIEAEDPRSPLSDSAISEMLKQQGFVVARRTVAKYREIMHISPANQRKSI